MSEGCTTVGDRNRPLAFGEWDPFRGAREEDALNKFRGEDEWGPKRPKRKMGDVWTIIGALAGMIAGGILGYLVNPVIAVLGVVGGGILGVLAGSVVTSLTRKRIKDRIQREHRSRMRGGR